MQISLWSSGLGQTFNKSANFTQSINYLNHWFIASKLFCLNLNVVQISKTLLVKCPFGLLDESNQFVSFDYSGKLRKTKAILRRPRKTSQKSSSLTFASPESTNLSVSFQIDIFKWSLKDAVQSRWTHPLYWTTRPNSCPAIVCYRSHQA